MRCEQFADVTVGSSSRRHGLVRVAFPTGIPARGTAREEVDDDDEHNKEHRRTQGTTVDG